MNSSGLTNAKEEERLFRELTKAMLDNDSDKIDELMSVPDPNQPAVDPEANPDPDPTPSPEAQGEPANPDSGQPESGNSTPNDAVPPTPDAPQTNEELAAIKARLDAATQELHRYKSDAGRVPALQRRLAELERRLNPSKDQPKGSESTKSDVLDDESKQVLDKLRENDPVIADHIGQLLNRTVGTLRQQSEERQRQADQEEYERLLEEQERAEYDRLLTLVPQADQVFRSNEWAQWKKYLRPADRAYAESSNADEVYAAIQWFARDMQALAAQQPAAPQQPTQTPATPAGPSTPTPEAPRPSAAPKVKTNLAAQPSGATLTEQEEFERVCAEIRKRDGIS